MALSGIYVDDYIERLREWERSTADPAIYDRIDFFFPSYGFKRIHAGGRDDRWVSPLKLNLTKPKHPTPNKTVVSRSDFSFREQGEWDDRVWVIEKLRQDWGMSSPYEVYMAVADRLGLTPPQNGGGKAAAGAAERRRQLLDAIQEYFVWNLWGRDDRAVMAVRGYLENKRGFSEASAKKIGFGFVPAWDRVEKNILGHRLKFTPEEIEAACPVKSDDGYTSVGQSHVLSIPYRSGEELKGFLFRRIDDGQPKYKANTGLDRKGGFFNVPATLSGEGRLVVVEGEMDALTASAAGIENVAAIGGSDISGERVRQVEDALRRGMKSIVLCLDLDEKDGIPDKEKRHRAIMRSIHAIRDIRPDFEDIYIAAFTSPCDPDEFVRNRGGEEFRRFLSQAVPYWKYMYYYYSFMQH